MRLFRKVSIICLTVCMLACLAIGAIFTMSYAEPVKTGYGNAQLYKENDIKFEDRLWDVDYYKAHRDGWKVISGPYAENNWGSGNFNYSGYDTQNRGISNYSATVSAYLIDGTYYYGPATGDVNKITKVFTYVGFPDSTLYPMPKGGYPAMICVHGGGGTAYAEWVAEWTSRGYVAIAMDTEGKVPLGVTGGGTTFYGQIDTVSKAPGVLYGEWVASGDVNSEAYKILTSQLGDGTTFGMYSYAKQNAWFSDTLYGTDYKTHWFYQATAAVIASNTFIRTFDNVNPEKIGITGISYGSYLTSLAVGYDGRFACAVPIYGSLNQQIGSKYFAQSVMPTDGRNSVAGELWDNPEILVGNKTPMLYLMSNHDAHFDVRSTYSCADLMPNTRVVIRDRYPHSHHWAARYSNSAVAPYTNEVLDYVASYLENDSSRAVPNVESNLFEFADRYMFDINMPANSGRTVTSAKVYYATKDLLINDLDYYRPTLAWNTDPVNNPPGTSVYGDYQYGDIVLSGGKEAVEDDDGNQKVNSSGMPLYDYNGSYDTTNNPKLDPVFGVGANGEPEIIDWVSNENTIPDFGYSGRWENAYALWQSIDLTLVDDVNHPTANRYYGVSGNTWRAAFPISGTDALPSDATFFYVEMLDSYGHYLTSRVIDVGAGERPLYTTRLYDYNRLIHENTIVEYDWSADGNGFSTNSRGWAYIAGYGPLIANSDGTFTTGDPVIKSEYVNDAIMYDGVYYPGYRTNIGVRQETSSYSNGVSSLHTDGGAVFNYRAFNVYDDIEFYYNISSEDFFKAVTNSKGESNVYENTDENAELINATTNQKNEDTGNPYTDIGGHCYFFSLFNSIESMFGCGNEPWVGGVNAPKIFVAGTNCQYEDQSGLYRGPLAGRLSTNMGSLIGNPNYNEFIYDEDPTSGVSNQLWFSTDKFFDETKLDSENWDDVWYKVTIRILDDGSYLYVNGNPLKDPATGLAYKFPAKREDFTNGFAYLSYTNSGNMKVNIKFNEDSYISMWGQKFDFNKVDSNGFSTYTQNAGTQYYLNGVYEKDSEGWPTSDPEIGLEFGSVENYVSGGVSTFVFNDKLVTGTGAVKNPETGEETGETYSKTDGSVIRYVPFDVNKDIQFSYNFTGEYKVDTYTLNSFYYYIGLYDSLGDAFASADEGWDAYKNDYSPVISLSGSNMSGYSKDGYSRAETNGKVKLYADYKNFTYFWGTEADKKSCLSWNFYPMRGVETYNSTTQKYEVKYEQSLDEVNWDDYYVDVRIRIGDTFTSIYIDGMLYLTTTQFTKSDFPQGEAYLKFYAFVQNGEVKVNFKLHDEEMTLYKTYDSHRTVNNHGNTNMPINANWYNDNGDRYQFPMNEYGWLNTKDSVHGNFNSDAGVYYSSPDKEDKNRSTIVNYWDSAASITQNSDGITTYQFDASHYGMMAINNIGFNVKDDIRFKFRVNDGDAANSQGKSFFVISLFDTLTAAYASAETSWDTSSGNGFHPEIAFESANSKGVDGRNYYGQLQVNLGPRNFVFVNYDKTTGWSNKYTVGRDNGEDFNEIIIRVLNQMTLVYLNGELFGYYTNLGRADFSTGKAYLKIFDYTARNGSGITTFDLITYQTRTSDETFDYSVDKYNGIGNSLIDMDQSIIYRNKAGEKVIDSRYGLAQTGTFGLNSASLPLDHSYTVDYRGWDVTKDIVFKYSVPEPTNILKDASGNYVYDLVEVLDENGNVEKDENGNTKYRKKYYYTDGDPEKKIYGNPNDSSTWFNIAFFDSAELALKQGMESWLYNYYNNNSIISLFGCNDPNGRVPEMERFQDEANVVASGYQHKFGVLSFNDQEWSYENQPVIKTSTYRTVKIRILDDRTEFYLDGVLYCTNTNITRSTFTYGKAYMSVAAPGATTINLEFDRPAEIYEAPSGNVYDYATDANGWTTFKNSTANIMNAKMPTLYNAEYDAVSNPSGGYVADCYFSRNNGATINEKGQSVLNLGVPTQDGYGVIDENVISKPTYAVQTTGFDVDKPIRIVYRFDSFAEAGGKRMNSSCLIFSLTETLLDAYNVKTMGWDPSLGLQKLMFRTTNSLWEGSGDWKDGTYAGYLAGFAADASDTTLRSQFLYNCSQEDYVSATKDSSLWQRDITLDINIGENGTVISINGQVVDLGYSNVKRSDFKFGKAYLNVCAHGGVNVCIATSQDKTGYEETTELLLNDSLDIINTFELPVGYHTPKLRYTIPGHSAPVVTDFAIDGGILTFLVPYVSPHLAGYEITVDLLGTIDNVEKVASTKTFTLKAYLEALLTTCGEDTAKRNLVVSLMNLCAAGQAAEGVAELGSEISCNANLKETEKAFEATFDALGDKFVISNPYKTVWINEEFKGKANLGISLNIGIATESSYYITFQLASSYDINKLVVNVKFDSGEAVAYTLGDALTEGKFIKVGESQSGTPIYKIAVSGIKSCDFDKLISFEFVYDGNSYGTNQGSILGYVDKVVNDTTGNISAETVAFAKAVYLYWLNITEYSAQA